MLPFPLQLGEPLASWVLDPELDMYCRMDRSAVINAAAETINVAPEDLR